jgi:hypothetical protein
LLRSRRSWCGACAQLKPTWEALADRLAGLVRVGAVNCEVEKALCAMHGATSFPTIKLLRGGASVANDASSDRSVEGLASWALEQLPTAQIAPLSARRPETLDAYLAGPCAKALARASAAGEGGGCFVVAHKEAAAPPWLKTLSFGVRARAAFAEARGAGADALAARLLAGDPTLPAVVALCGGDVRRALPMPRVGAASEPGAPLSRDAVETFVEHVLHGGACDGVEAREVARLDVREDYSRQRIAALRALLAARGDACAGCAEKSDFVAAVLRHAQAEADAEAAAAAGGGAAAAGAPAPAPAASGADGEL